MKFKVGDRVKVKNGVKPGNGWGNIKPDDTGIIRKNLPTSPRIALVIDFPNHYGWNAASLDEIELALAPHVHAEIIKQWADDTSLTVQVKLDDGTWKNTQFPCWGIKNKYRIKEHVKFNEIKQYQVAYMWYGRLLQSYGRYLDKEDFEKQNTCDSEFIGLIFSTEKIEKVEVE
jgi:hypothetical protein